jgi:hypothetical protein
VLEPEHYIDAEHLTSAFEDIVLTPAEAMDDHAPRVLPRRSLRNMFEPPEGNFVGVVHDVLLPDPVKLWQILPATYGRCAWVLSVVVKLSSRTREQTTSHPPPNHFSLQIAIKRRADERTRTAYPCSSYEFACARSSLYRCVRFSACLCGFRWIGGVILFRFVDGIMGAWQRYFTHR